ncbi:hypothetical protein AVEN_158599-1 [Araneus ventricosus]|uniref:Uncharacterized protein n=1 Tax=Araneus ventricosus TaxID=182803 RepID=A0A4Y2JK97_ARAVE|nr:hypothetical protein AVEN_158599-1 [Araneus ventricosus]
MARFVRPVPVTGKKRPFSHELSRDSIYPPSPDSERSLQCHLLKTDNHLRTVSSHIASRITSSEAANLLRMLCPMPLVFLQKTQHLEGSAAVSLPLCIFFRKTRCKPT